MNIKVIELLNITEYLVLSNTRQLSKTALLTTMQFLISLGHSYRLGNLSTKIENTILHLISRLFRSDINEDGTCIYSDLIPDILSWVFDEDKNFISKTRISGMIELASEWSRNRLFIKYLLLDIKGKSVISELILCLGKDWISSSKQETINIMKIVIKCIEENPDTISTIYRDWPRIQCILVSLLLSFNDNMTVYHDDIELNIFCHLLHFFSVLLKHNGSDQLVENQRLIRKLLLISSKRAYSQVKCRVSGTEISPCYLILDLIIQLLSLRSNQTIEERLIETDSYGMLCNLWNVLDDPRLRELVLKIFEVIKQKYDLERAYQIISRLIECNDSQSTIFDAILESSIEFNLVEIRPILHFLLFLACFSDFDIKIRVFECLKCILNNHNIRSLVIQIVIPWINTRLTLPNGTILKRLLVTYLSQVIIEFVEDPEIGYGLKDLVCKEKSNENNMNILEGLVDENVTNQQNAVLKLGDLFRSQSTRTSTLLSIASSLLIPLMFESTGVFDISKSSTIDRSLVTETISTLSCIFEYLDFKIYIEHLKILIDLYEKNVLLAKSLESKELLNSRTYCRNIMDILIALIDRPGFGSNV
jgi:hypothetical protein